MAVKLEFYHAGLHTLPMEIIYIILSYFDPIDNIRDLRHLIRATRDTNSSTIAWLANAMLLDSRERLLKTAKLSHNQRNRFSVDSIVEVFVGRQFVCEAEPTDGDAWAFKRSQLPGSPKISSQVRSSSTLYNLNRLNVMVGPLNSSNEMSQEDDIANKFNKTGRYSKKATLNGSVEKARMEGKDAELALAWNHNAIYGYGGVCTRIWWG